MIGLVDRRRLAPPRARPDRRDRRRRRDRGFDPFLAASPVLIGLAVGLITIRLYPIPGPRPRLVVGAPARPRPGARAAHARPLPDGRLPAAPDPDADHGDRHAVVVVQASVEGSQVDVSWQEVGADYRIETASGGPLDPDLDPRTLPGVEAVAAGITRRRRADRRRRPGPSATFLLRAVDPGLRRGPGRDRRRRSPLPTWFAAAPTGRDAGTAGRPDPGRRLDAARRPGARRSPTATLFELKVEGPAR